MQGEKRQTMNKYEKSIERIKKNVFPSDNWAEEDLEHYRTVIEALELAVKQREGEWIKDNTSNFEHRYNCSVCDFRQVGKPTPCCPNCGARMKGG